MNFGVKEAVETFLKWLDDHFSLRYFFMFATLSAVFLFGINPFLTLLGLPMVPPMWRVCAAIGLLIFGSGTVMFSVEKGLIWGNSRLEKHHRSRMYKDLSEDELYILATFATNGTKTEVFYENEQPLFSLVRKVVLKQAGEYYMGSGMSVDRNVYSLTAETNDWIRSQQGKEILGLIIAKQPM